jgi:small subunit ribosomal protein S20
LTIRASGVKRAPFRRALPAFYDSFSQGLQPPAPQAAHKRTNMANTPQAKKRIRRNERRSEINTNRMSRIRSFVKRVEAAIAEGDKSAASDALRAAQPELARGVARGVLHRNTASRKMSRLSKRVAAL